MSPRCLLLLGSLWVTGIVLGTSLVLRHDYGAGPEAAVPLTWPEGSALPRPSGVPTLIMFAHPMCPCTRASIHELAALIKEFHYPITAWVVLLEPAEGGEDWRRSELWESAEQMPGVTVVADPGGKEAHCFGAVTSGHVMLYNAHQRLQFSGGVTRSRGHEGGSPGRAVLLAALHATEAALRSMPIFGCSLLDPESAESALAP